MILKVYSIILFDSCKYNEMINVYVCIYKINVYLKYEYLAHIQVYQRLIKIMFNIPL